MQHLLLLTVTVLLTCPSSILALNILGISTVTSLSHHIWFTELMRGLARNGHQIYALALKQTEIQEYGLTENQTQSFVFEGIIDDFHQKDFFDPVGWSRMSPLQTAMLIHRLSSDACEAQIATQGAKQVLELVKKTKIDVIVQDLTASQCFYGLWEVAKGNPVIVGFTPFGLANWVKDVVGGNNWPAIKNFHYSHNVPPYTLWEKTLNFVHLEVDDLLRRYYYMPKQQAIAEEYVGQKMSSSIHEVEKKVSVLLTNSYPALDIGTFLPANVIEVGGLHVRDPKSLPEDVKEFLDGAEHGAIVISLGSQIQSSSLTSEKLKVIVAALSQLKQRVLWKFESIDLKDKPKNVMIRKWLPQSDVLGYQGSEKSLVEVGSTSLDCGTILLKNAHPNIRVLWTHSGLLSIQEAIWRGVPVVGMPFFIDQRCNIDLLVQNGIGLHLDFESLSEKSILQVLDRILTDPSYSLRMKQISLEYRDRPMSPLDYAVWHVEHASRHPRGPLVSPAREMNGVQLNLLDVYAVLGAAVISIISIFWILITACVNLFSPRKKTKTA